MTAVATRLCSRSRPQFRFRHISIGTGFEGEAGNPPQAKEETMTNEKYPRGWNEARVRRILEYYESQSDEEAAAEIEAGFKSTTMEVPHGLVPVVRQLIAKRRSAQATRTKLYGTGLQPSASRAKSPAVVKAAPRSRRLKP
ncbi:MAG: hypothetical protein A3F68_07745 [Acidobacteria bacterium RIFCSPLOWO2_12_FULL_54_10]|nr:MAG: hypothetical protein A3F68_07745 [Acidobacteria bacterium RIFCSPLOWO2_12_FULL_54_10]